MSEHTKQRLVVTSQDDFPTGCASFEDRQSYSPDTVVLYHDNAKADARRIVACWNACEGMVNPKAEINVLRTQRDELLEALQQAIAWIDGENTPIDQLSKARELVEKITGATHE